MKKANKKKKTDSPDNEWLFESPVGPDIARTRDILDTIPDEIVPGWKAQPEDKDDVFDRAMLIARSRPRDQRHTAKGLLKEAEFEVGEKRLEAMAAEADASAQVVAEAREQEEERLAALRFEYQDGVESITGYRAKGHWDRALEQFKKFLAEKAKKEGKTEGWAEAKLATYRAQGFTGTEVKQLREEFEKWRGYRGQGRVVRKGDLRLSVNKKKKMEKAQKAAESQTRLAKPKPKVEPFWDSSEARRTAAGKRSAKS